MIDPKRLIVSEDNELGVALAAARRQLPDADRLALLAQRLAESGVNVPHDLPVVRSAPERALGLKLKLGIGLAVVAGLGIVGVATHSRSARAPEMTGAEPARAAVAVQVTRAEAPSAAPVTSAASVRPVVAVGHASRPVAPAAVEVDAVAEPAAPSVPAPQPSAAAPRSAARPHAAAVTAPPVTSSGDVYVPPSGAELPTSELELVKQARNAVAADPARAYALTERSRAQFPSGAFGQERDFIALTALFRMGREQQARSQASVFRSRYPRSAYLPQIQRMLGEQ